MHRTGIVVALALLTGAAHAAPTSTYPWVSEPTEGGPEFVRQVVPAAATTGLAKSRTIYLNREGAMLTPGFNDARANTSSIVARATQVAGWNASAADWAATVACMKAMWSRFDVVITDVDPGATPHIEALFARSPADVGLTSKIGGISPFSANCSVIENSIVFTFTDNLPKRPQTICEVMSQEIAHSYGLDHELLASDPMTYLPFAGNRAFQDRDSACGESTERPCGIAGTTCRASQNSVQLLVARLGAANRDHTPPSVGITEPAEMATVPAGFAIAATASDNIAVRSVAFYVDGDLVATQTQGPYQLITDPEMIEGVHTIVVEATDADGNTAMQTRDIVVAGPLDPLAFGCSAGRTSPTALLGLALVALLRRRRSVR
jgi:MYXO-CTERM domain-containing protein